MLKILGRRTSINVRKVLWACAEMQLPYELEEWGTSALPSQSPEFLALNPNAMVPVIKDDSFVLWESNAICRYLATAHDRDDLLPREAQARALVEQWMDWQAGELNNSWRYAYMGLVRESPLHKDRAAIDASVVNWNRHMGILDRQLSLTQGFVTGAAFTLADVGLGLSVNRWFMTPMQRAVLPAIDAYYELLTQRPGFREHGRNGMS